MSRNRSPRARRGAVAALGTFCLLLVGVAHADAATLYAYPGGTGVNCASDTETTADCPLQTALNDAAAGDTVMLAGGQTYSGSFTIATSGTSAGSPVTLTSPAADPATLSGGAPTLSVNAAVHLDISDLTFSGADNTALFGGGAIDNRFGGVLSVSDSTFSDNTGSDGGAIENGNRTATGAGTATGTLTVADSTFDGNTALIDGGAIDNADGGSGTLTVTDSTFAGNTALLGGAITTADGGAGTATVVGSTFDADRAGDGPDVVYGGSQNSSLAFAGDIFTGSCTLISSITDAGYNAGSGGSCESGGTHDSTTLTASDLGPLADNGGPTDTVALLGTAASDPAIGLITASPTTVTLGGRSYALCGAGATDQRGEPRPGTGASSCDAGAYETQGVYSQAALPLGLVRAARSSLRVSTRAGSARLSVSVPSRTFSNSLPVSFDADTARGSKLRFVSATLRIDTTTTATLHHSIRSLALNLTGLKLGSHTLSITTVYRYTAGQRTRTLTQIQRVTFDRVY